MYNEEEVSFQCPYCFQTISMVFESMYGGQSYIEDCEVCCQPIEVSYRIHEGETILEKVERAQ